ncbi:DUF4282 domain-containing protein [Trabulsiella odontotermitis]|uniref:DUF4282 domain-containing protein n=1 Tax=Trabulsiella odontotermitis TaxID=379893 RepID=A0A0L0GHA8_9ENTR|nr:DUF4282 domain-containing protein [Trabulsiella odontotermitis]KNC88430.1 hypothetical protein GM31_10805 [Trabulsiella odontotermitis]
MKQILGFDYLLTPKVMVFLYWIFMVLIVVGGIFSMFNGQLIAGFFGTIFSLIGCRVMFELIMIAFKNNEYLRRIAENSDKAAQ